MKDDITYSECVCSSQQGLFIPNRQVTFIVAGTLMFFFLTFVAGYVIARCQYNHKTALPAQIEQPPLMEINPEVIDETSEVAALEAIQSLDQEESMAYIAPAQEGSVLQEEKPFYAQLIGFGTSLAAHRFAQRLQKKGLAVAVKTRYSKTPKGNDITWYQVVTESFSNREALEQMVEQISRDEHLTGARIVSC